MPRSSLAIQMGVQSGYELNSIESGPLTRKHNVQDSTDDPESPTMRAQTWQTRLSGWRGGLFVQLLVATFVLVLNTIIAVVAGTSWKYSDGAASAYTGSCTTTNRMNVSAHVAINILSSLLLGASNYCAQRLAAPTRSEVDRAHKKRKWLDIGLPSVRNLVLIGKSRVLLWVLLMISSVPLHFLYNAVVFETIDANFVSFAVVKPEFFTNKTSWEFFSYDIYNIDPQGDAHGMTDPNPDFPNGYAWWNSSTTNPISNLQDLVLDGKYLNPIAFENLTKEECLSRYSGNFVLGGSALAVPSDALAARYAASGMAYGPPERSHGGPTDIPWTSVYSFREATAQLTGDQRVRQSTDYAYCLSEKVESHCQVQFSIPILCIVIAFNALKVILMALSLWGLKDETLVTLGDAITSFLHHPDPETKDRCLMSNRNIKKMWQSPHEPLQQTYSPSTTPESWFAACSKTRWAISLLLYVIILIVAISFFHFGVYSSQGFGSPTKAMVVRLNHIAFKTSLVPYILIANVPQTIVSFLYLSYNGLFTSMLATREWTQYSHKRAPLRVSIPRSGQRSTHFLQLPYTWGIPLMLASMFLHWLISQCLFLIRIVTYRDGVALSVGATYLGSEAGFDSSLPDDTVYSGLGYSSIALVVTVVWGTVLVGACLFVAAKGRYPGEMPLGGTNSAVISAACHVLLSKEESHAGKPANMAQRPLMWGAVVQPGDEEGSFGHCAFSDGHVEPPIRNHHYRGLNGGDERVKVD